MTKTRTSRFISMLICVCMAVLCIQGLSFRAAALEVTEWQIGDSINLAGKWVSRDDQLDNFGSWVGDTCTVPEPSYNESWGQWNFNSVLDGYNLFITVPDGKTGSDTPTGFKIKSGSGTEVDPYRFELIYTATAHTHNYAFSANGDTITVNCDKAGCTEPPYTASITLIPPTLTTEGGEGSPEATLLFTGIDEDLLAYWNCTMEDLVAVAQNAIAYYNGDEKLDEAPTEAGDYTAKLTIYADGEYTAVISYTIAEAESEEEPDPEPAPAPSAPIVISGTAKAASGGAPGLVSGTSGSLEMLTWNAKLDGSTLTWEAKDGADGFVISIRAKGAKAFKRFDRVTEKSADLSRLKAGTYTIYVRYEKDGKLAKCRQSARITITIK
ncbi:MAG: hypothetical protein IJ149_04395 [Oscillospiraceae bacterium]|nr:hypothetical protein [Oscillospiraceae bacterium]